MYSGSPTRAPSPQMVAREEFSPQPATNEVLVMAVIETLAVFYQRVPQIRTHKGLWYVIMIDMAWHTKDEPLVRLLNNERRGVFASFCSLFERATFSTWQKLHVLEE